MLATNHKLCGSEIFKCQWQKGALNDGGKYWTLI
jgi:hypothetical protein